MFVTSPSERPCIESAALWLPGNHGTTLRLGHMHTQGDRFCYAMMKRGVRKQMAFAVALGVNESAVSRWRKGNGLSIKHAVQICELLDISLDWLVLGRGAMDQHRVPDHRPVEPTPVELFTATSGLSARVVAAMANLAASVQAELDAAQRTERE